MHVFLILTYDKMIKDTYELALERPVQIKEGLPSYFLKKVRIVVVFISFLSQKSDVFRFITETVSYNFYKTLSSILYYPHSMQTRSKEMIY
eukprot:snap_masked-scaffold_28-processed-gene-3.35-mRNA-1 protein AED:1.00 eAED:1.00 QI:0/0/0/0/1/1/2/0/90